MGWETLKSFYEGKKKYNNDFIFFNWDFNILDSSSAVWEIERISHLNGKRTNQGRKVSYWTIVVHLGQRPLPSDLIHIVLWCVFCALPWPFSLNSLKILLNS